MAADSDSIKRKGIIIKLGDEEQKSAKLTVRQVVIQTMAHYPQFLVLEAVNDKCSLLNGLRVGNIITAYFDIRGKEWKAPEGITKYFMSLSLWKIKVEKDVKEPEEEENTEEKLFPTPNKPPTTNSTDDLPW